MSKHYSWWPYVKEIIRAYPVRIDAELSGVALIDYHAVEDAIDKTEQMTDGQSRLKLIRLLHWNGTHTVQGAADEIPCDKSTAYRWQRRFFEEVARNRELID